MNTPNEKPQTAAEILALAAAQQRRRAQILSETPEETSRRFAEKQAEYKNREAKP